MFSTSTSETRTSESHTSESRTSRTYSGGPENSMSTSITFTGKRPSAQNAERTTRTYSDDPFRARFGHRLPRGLRQEARGMEWRTFMETYSPTRGPIAIRDFSAERLPAGRWNYTAELTLGRGTEQERNCQREITAMGPASACTNLLANEGYRVEIVEFHQFEIFEATATFLYTSHNNDHVWTMGFGQAPAASVMKAMVCAANRLHG